MQSKAKYTEYSSLQLVLQLLNSHVIWHHAAGDIPTVTPAKTVLNLVAPEG